MSGDTGRALGPILVVDDDPGLREIIREALEDEGLVVEAACDGMQALELAARHRPTLVVLDWGLPVLDGGAVAARLREVHGDGLRILVVTADGRAAEKARRVRAVGYLDKPFNINRLVSTVWRSLADP